jgi:DNA-binding transcriptional MerR regulator
MSTHLSIGDFSAISHLSVKALRYYHEVGLLQPVSVDSSSGYRFYTTTQVPTAQLIRRLRKLEMPIPEVRAVLAASDRWQRDTLIAAHLQRMESILSETRAAVRELRQMLTTTETEFLVSLRTVQAVQAAAITATVGIGDIGAWWEDSRREIRALLRVTQTVPSGFSGGLFAQELFTDEIGVATVFVPVVSPVALSGRVKMVEIPPARLAITVHRGSLGTADRTYGALGTYVAEHSLAATGPVTETYVVTGDDTADEGRLRTEICWPVHH